MTRDLMPVYLLAVVVAFLVSPLTQAQDVVALVSGKKVRGEVIHQDKKVIEIVTRKAELIVVNQSEVDAVKIGRALNRKLAAQIIGHEKSPDKLMAAVAWAEDQKSLKKDRLRLARRALALDNNCDKARLFLGQVKMGGIWYKNQKSADREFAKIKRQQGFVYLKGAWLKSTEKRNFLKNPGAFMLDGKRHWRLTDELMKERHMIMWKEAWYKPTEKALVEDLRKFEEAVGGDFQGAEKSPTRVVIQGRRGEAQKLLKDIQKTRRWFDDLFRPQGQSFASGPSSLYVILNQRGAYERFLTRGTALHGADSAKVKSGLTRDSMSFSPLSRVSHQEEPLWKNTIIAGLGAAMMRYWGHEDFLAPPCLYVASGQMAEFLALKEIRIHFVSTSRYDKRSVTQRKYRSLGEAKKMLVAARSKGETIDLGRLFKTTSGGMTPLHEAQSIFLLDYLSSEHKEGLRTFVQDKGSADVVVRFSSSFGMNFQELEKKFWTWFDRQ